MEPSYFVGVFRSRNRAGTVVCPNCGSQDGGSPKFCGRCGTSLTPSAPAAPPTSQPVPPDHGLQAAHPSSAYGPSPAVASPAEMNILGFVFVAFAIIASGVAFFLFVGKQLEWSAGIFLLSTILFWVAGRFFHAATAAR